MTHPLPGNPRSPSVCFHVRRMPNGRVTSSLGTRIRPGHRVTLSGPFGSAHFNPDQQGRLVLVATSTGFAPILSIAVAALRENPQRMMMIIAGGRSPASLYMRPALVHLGRFPNVLVVPVCSTPQPTDVAVRPGRPTDYLPRLLPTDAVYACGAPAMVDAVRAIAAHVGAVCHSDPYLPTYDEPPGKAGLAQAVTQLALPSLRQLGDFARERMRVRPERRVETYPMAEAGVKSHYRT